MAYHLIGDNILVQVAIGGAFDGTLAWNSNSDPSQVPTFGASSGTGFNAVVSVTGIARRIGIKVDNQKISVKGLGQANQAYRFSNYSGSLEIEAFQTNSTTDPISNAGYSVGHYVYITVTPLDGTTQYYLGVIDTWDIVAQSGDVCTITFTADLTPDHSP